MRALICVAALTCLTVPAVANDWTPFYDEVFKVGETYERTATVAWLGGEKYILLVQSDTIDTFVVYARAKKGVVKPEQLGERQVKAKILSREKDGSGRAFHVEVEILGVK